MKKNVLLTGGTGYVGNNIISKLNFNYNFINLGRSQTKLCDNIEWNIDKKIEINESIDTVIHGAAIVGNTTCQINEYIDSNIKFTNDLLEWAANSGVKNFIYLSTGGVYGFKEDKFKETDICNPKGIYNLTKKFSEDLCLLNSNKMRVIINRLFFPYGPNQKGRLFYNLIDNMFNERKINLNKNGGPFINPIYIDDLVNIINLQIQSNEEGIFNLCGMEDISIENIARIINSYLNLSNLQYVYNDKEVSNLLGDNNRIINVFKYKFENSIDMSIKTIINFNAKNYN